MSKLEDEQIQPYLKTYGTTKESYKKRVDEITDRLYRSPTENFLYKTVHKSPVRASYTLSQNTLQEHKERAIDYKAVAEFSNLEFFRSLVRSPRSDVKAKYTELMKSFKDEPIEQTFTEIVPQLSPLEFQRTIDDRRKSDKKKHTQSFFKHEQKAWKEIMHNFTTTKSKPLVPPSHQPSKNPSFVSIYPRTSVTAQQEPNKLFTARTSITTHEKPFSPKKLSIAERSQEWQSAVNGKIMHSKTLKKQGEMQECTFTPVRVTKMSKLASGYEEAVAEKTEALVYARYFGDQKNSIM